MLSTAPAEAPKSVGLSASCVNCGAGSDEPCFASCPGEYIAVWANPTRRQSGLQFYRWVAFVACSVVVFAVLQGALESRASSLSWEVLFYYLSGQPIPPALWEEIHWWIAAVGVAQITMLALIAELMAILLVRGLRVAVANVRSRGAGLGKMIEEVVWAAVIPFGGLIVVYQLAEAMLWWIL